MKTNKLDNSIKEKLQNRTLEPSASAWERLSIQLDEQPKQKKKGLFFYVGIVASILLLMSVGLLYFNKNEATKPIEIIVNNPIDTNSVDKKIDKLINEIPTEKALVNIDEVEVKQEINKVTIAKKEQQIHQNKKDFKAIKDTQIAKVHIDENSSENKKVEPKKEILQQNPNSRIKINSNDLLYAVTHTSEEVKTYYAKYNLNRDDILKTIKSELKKSNIKVNPETILAEVERTINDDDFQNNFMKSLKQKVYDIATVIASRND